MTVRAAVAAAFAVLSVWPGAVAAPVAAPPPTAAPARPTPPSPRADAMPADYRLPPFVLPAPGGRFPVGTLAFTIADADRTPLPVVAWYPAHAAGGRPAPYLDDAERRLQAPAVARNFRWPAGALDALATISTHAYAGIAPAPGRFPLVVFSHGYMGYPRQNTALMEWLAARGYVVLSLAHPGDAADLPIAGGGVIATVPTAGQPQPDPVRLQRYWDGADHAARAAASRDFWRALRGGRLRTSLSRWRSRIIRLTDLIAARRVPPAVLPIARAADVGHTAYVGFSFGGSASASACRVDRRCRAAVNLDGFEFDRALHDRPVRAPLLLIQSDWTRYPNMGRANPDFTIYDYAYEPWRRATASPPVYRFRISDTRHLGLTDLALAPRDPVRDRMVGPAAGAGVVAAVDAIVGAFLDREAAGRGGDVVAVAAAFPQTIRHHRRPPGGGRPSRNHPR